MRCEQINARGLGQELFVRLLADYKQGFPNEAWLPLQTSPLGPNVVKDEMFLLECFTIEEVLHHRLSELSVAFYNATFKDEPVIQSLWTSLNRVDEAVCAFLFHYKKWLEDERTTERPSRILATWRERRQMFLEIMNHCTAADLSRCMGNKFADLCGTPRDQVIIEHVERLFSSLVFQILRKTRELEFWDETETIEWFCEAGKTRASRWTSQASAEPAEMSSQTELIELPRTGRQSNVLKPAPAKSKEAETIAAQMKRQISWRNRGVGWFIVLLGVICLNVAVGGAIALILVGMEHVNGTAFAVWIGSVVVCVYLWVHRDNYNRFFADGGSNDDLD